MKKIIFLYEKNNKKYLNIKGKAYLCNRNACFLTWKQAFFRSKRSGIQKTIEYRFFFGWSWWDSNPRPHKETIRFLHAYFSLHFRDMTRPEPPIISLSSKFSPLHRGLQELFPICLHRLTNKIRNQIR